MSPASPTPESPSPNRPALPFRSRVEHAVIPALSALSRIPQPVALLGVVAVFAAGTFLPYGGILILLLAIPLALLAYVTWPHLQPPERMLRLAVLVLTVGVGIVRCFPN